MFETLKRNDTPVPDSPAQLKVGTRCSPLAHWQTQAVLARLQTVVPHVGFETLDVFAPGDLDLQTDLRESPADFFTRTLDEGLLKGDIDLAVHSAKDLPDPLADGIDWFWMPDAGDRRDALIGTLQPTVIGVSSARRADYARKRFPGAICKSVRGTIQDRIRQLDDGHFDLLIMAGVALQRLGLEDRITAWIPLAELDPPEAQGALAVTFRRGDQRIVAIRNVFMKTATFAGAGIGRGNITEAAIDALSVADVCLYDALMDETVLRHLPAGAKAIYVGKREGEHSSSQDEINQMLCDHVRRGVRVVRLKGGDPSIFGRLAEEVDALDALGLASRVLPGISAMQAASAQTGILLTRRGVARGFTVMTPRLQGGGQGPVDAASRAALPVIFYMAVGSASAMATALMADGMDPDRPCALVFGAGSEQELVLRSSLAMLAVDLAQVDEAVRRLPGLFIVGDIARYGEGGARGSLLGRRVLLTCSESIMPKAVQAVLDGGGRPLRFPLIALDLLPDAAVMVRGIAQFDWVALTSPSAVRCFEQALRQEKVDYRQVPQIMATGHGTGQALEQIGLRADLVPEADFSAGGILDIARPVVNGRKVLRLRSDKAGDALAEGLRRAGAEVADVVLYQNRQLKHAQLPPFDDVFFASVSAVDAWMAQWGMEPLRERCVLTMGQPTARALIGHGLQPTVTGTASTVSGVLESLACHHLQPTEGHNPQMQGRCRHGRHRAMRGGAATGNPDDFMLHDEHRNA